MMPRQTYRLSCKSQLSVCSTLIFHHAVAFLLLTHSDGGLSQQIGQPQPIAAMVGDDITLPCHVKPDPDAINKMLEWSRLDLVPRFVHLRRFGKEHLVDQNPSYKGRTSVSTDRLKQGDMSLTLSKVKLSDDGTYRCFIPELNTESSVQLHVGVVFEMTKVSIGVLECKSKGWNPEPEVFWLDGEGNLLSAGPTETVRGPDDLYTVSSRVTVERRHSNSFTCRVQQKNLSQTRETRIHVPDDFFTDSSRSSAPTIIGLVVGIMFILAVAFVVWKWRQNQINTKKLHEDEETQGGGEEKSNPISNDSEQQTECLMTKEPDRQTETMENQNKVEEENNIKSSSEETRLLPHTEKVTQKEKLRTEGETDNIPPHRKGDIKEQSVNTGTGSQCVVENERQQQRVQIGGETMIVSDNREEETKSPSEETQTPQEGKVRSPGAGEKKQDEFQTGGKRKPEERTNSVSEETKPPHLTKTETHTEQSEKNVDRKAGEEETKSELTDQGLMDGDRKQQPVSAGGEANDDIDKKDEEEKSKSTNNEAAGQAPTEAETQKNGGENKTPQTEQLPEGKVQSPGAGEKKQDEFQSGGKRKPEERTNSLSEETKPPCSSKTETHTEQQTDKESEKVTDNRDGEESMTSRE